MASKLADVAEGVKDRVFGAPTYQTKVKRFANGETLAKNLVKGDMVVAGDSVGAMPSFGIASGSQHEVERVEGLVLVLKGGKRILAEWFIPEVRRRERVRQKADRQTLIGLVASFAASRWNEFKNRLDQEITTAKVEVTKAEADVLRAQNRLKQTQDAVVALEKAKVDGEAWPRGLADKMINLVDKKLFTNFEIVKEGEVDVFIAYTGPLWIEAKPESKVERQRGEYALKLYPSTSRTRIVVENVMPGKLPTDVPFNEGRAGGSNVCFGGQNSELENLIRNEDWVRALTMVRVFLEGNRTN